MFQSYPLLHCYEAQALPLGVGVLTQLQLVKRRRYRRLYWRLRLLLLLG